MMSIPEPPPPPVFIISSPYPSFASAPFTHRFPAQRLHLGRAMASSVTMTASFMSGLSTAGRPAVSRRPVVMAKAARAEAIEKAEEISVKAANGRRDLMFAAAAAICSAAAGCGIALAEAKEPKRGSLEAKKKYGPICVTMPTASVCHN